MLASASRDDTSQIGTYDGNVFERFTDQARQVLVLAQEEARRLNHGFIETEHLLLGLVRQGDGLAAQVLVARGVTLEAVRDEVERINPAGSTPPGSPPFTSRAKKVLQLSLRESLQLGHNYIGTEHMLLGLLREGEGTGVRVLVSLGVDLSTIRQQVLALDSPVRPTTDQAPAVPSIVRHTRDDLPRDLYDRFTDQARQVMVLAEDEAHLLHHAFIGTEHLLLGLIDQGDGLAATVLTSPGISVEAVREKVQETIGPAGSVPTGSPPLTPRAKKVLELSRGKPCNLARTTSAPNTSCSALCARARVSAYRCSSASGWTCQRFGNRSWS